MRAQIKTQQTLVMCPALMDTVWLQEDKPLLNDVTLNVSMGSRVGNSSSHIIIQ